MIEACHISVQLGGAPILKDVSLSLDAGQLLMVVGPNGSGKTTLVRAMMDAIPHGGIATLDGKDISRMKARDRARRIGVLTQQNAPQFAYCAYDCVAVGRYAHRSGLLDRLGRDDQRAIEAAFAKTRTDHLRKRLLTTLSGGELQRVYLARVLAQEPEVLILDEPTNHLDIEHQILLFDIIRAWLKEGHRAVLAIVHDLNLAYAYGTHALLLHEGGVYAQGPLEEVFSEQNLRDVYHVDLAAWMRGMLSRWDGGQPP